jgi:alkanesulfonate monooxygenase SsuD/methylene tetrahydromethanopterin reductase-like flavin-dependent oxidoreductase (luciferase family)
LSGGRFELGLGAGAFQDHIAGMGGPRRSPGESVEALEEAIEVIRLRWSGERSVSFEGRHYLAGEPLAGPPDWWAETLTAFAGDGFDTLVFWPVDPSPRQVELLAGEVVPLLSTHIPD